MAAKLETASREGSAPSPIRVQIKGLRRDLSSDDTETFILEGARMVEVEWPKVAQVLEVAGIEQDDAERYVESFATEVFRKEMARTLAERLVLA